MIKNSFIVCSNNNFVKQFTFGCDVVMTEANHPSGTDRCMDALQQLKEDFEYVINIQGDEPFIEPEQVDELAAVLQDGTTELATQMIAVDSYEMLFDKGEVKVVLNKNNEALYFSRMVIPFIKGVDEKEWHKHHQYFRHVGMYAYRKDILQKITQLPVSSLEKAESLEQLRWIENGFTNNVHCFKASLMPALLLHLQGCLYNGFHIL